MKDHRRSSENDPSEIADAGALFDDVPASRPAPKPKPKTQRPVTSGDDLYEVQGVEDEPEDTPPLPVAAPTPRPKKPQPIDDEPRERPRLDPSVAVEEVWTRGAEWGGTVFKLAIAAAAVLGAVYMLLSFEQYGLAFLALLLGLFGLALLSYPMVITLERPVRITPEQAARDFYGALAHHVPHYRRMWLLLSSAGRVSRSYASFEGFRTYWKRRLSQLKKGRAGAFTPLKIQVADFRAEKSAGKTAVDAKYQINVFVRGRQEAGPIESVSVTASFVKGPDNMWYLDLGTLP